MVLFGYPDDFNYPDTYPDTRGQRGPDNRGSTVVAEKTANPKYLSYIRYNLCFQGYHSRIKLSVPA